MSTAQEEEEAEQKGAVQEEYRSGMERNERAIYSALADFLPLKRFMQSLQINGWLYSYVPS